NKAYPIWVKQDQLIASWLLSSLSENVLITTVGLNTSKEIWASLKQGFASHSLAKQMQLKLELQALKKGNMKIREYFNKVKGICDLLAAAGHKISENDQILHLLAGLGSDYNPVVISITSRTEACSMMEAYSILLSFESRLESTDSTNEGDGSFLAANLVTHSPNRGGRGFNSFRGRSNGQNQTNRGGRSNGRSGSSRGRGGRGFGNNRARCQICGYNNHTVDKCYYRFDMNFVPKSQNSNGSYQGQANSTMSLASMVNYGSQSSEGSQDMIWFPDSGATHHITNELNNLTLASEYGGNETIQTANGTGMLIAHSGKSMMKGHFPYHSNAFLLNNLMHVPQITNNLLSVS
ncbi:Unknown protein, partial [Striga hermonthica]